MNNKIVQNSNSGNTSRTKLVINLCKSLREARARIETLKFLLKIVPDIVYEIDPQGYFIFVNDAIRKLGYEPQNLIGKHFSSIIYPDDLENVSRIHVLPKYKGVITGVENAPKLFDERRSGNRATKNLRLRLLINEPLSGNNSTTDKPQAVAYFEVMASGFYLEKSRAETKKFLGTLGTIKSIANSEQVQPSDQQLNEESRSFSSFRGSVGILRDITEQKNLDERRAKLEEQYRQSQKLEAIGRLAGGIAHDFNNILAAISGYADIILKKFAPLHPRLKHYATVILAATKRAADLTSKLLAFARRGNYQNIAIDVHHAIKDIITAISDTLPDSITIEQNLAAEHATIMGDPYQIHEALLNIAFNARDALVKGGVISFETQIEQPSK